jgi:heme-degrading monooxygenase HmoA
VIARTWSGRTTLDKQHAYIEHFNGNVLRALKALDGFVEATLLRQERGDEVGIFVITTWESRDAIRAFAGADIERAVVEPEAVAALTSFDARVKHWDIVTSPSAAGNLGERSTGDFRHGTQQ